MNIMWSIYDALVEFSPDMELQGCVATEWRTVDETTWEFDIRNDIKFHNGDPLTAHDVAFSLNRIVAPDSTLRRKGFFAAFKEAVVVDDYKVRIITDRPFAVVPSVLTYLYIVPKQALESMGEEAFSLNPIGSGPYVFHEWLMGERITLKANADYWRTPATIDLVHWRSIPEDFTRVAELKTGSVDAIVYVPPDRVAEIEALPQLRVENKPVLRTVFIGMNTWNAPLSDMRVRQALNYAIDIEAIVETLLSGYAAPSGGPIPKNAWGFCESVQPYPYDPQKARQLLGEAGYPNGFQTTLEGAPATKLMGAEICEAVVGYLQEVGVDVTMNLAEFGSFFPRWLNKEVPDLYFLSFGVIFDPHMVLNSHMWLRGRGLYWNHPTLDAYIEDGLATFDPDARLKIYCDAQKFVHEQAPWIFLYDEPSIYGVNNRIDWTVRPDEQFLPYHMSLRTGN